MPWDLYWVGLGLCEVFQKAHARFLSKWSSIN